MSGSSGRVDIALLHHPVINKGGETIGSAVTNLDLHDLARAARTFGVGCYYLVTPYQDQHELIGEIVDHWLAGHGATYNPARKEALGIIRPHYRLDDVVADSSARHGRRPLLVATTARLQPGAVSYRHMRQQLEKDAQPILLLFGTAHGLADEVLEQADSVLTPIRGNTEYNHLSVRSAVSIILDRLLGCE